MASKAIFRGVAAALLVFAVSPLAAQDDQNVDLGGDLEISVPKDWQVRQYQNPAMNNPAVRDAVEDARETRLTADATSVMASFIHFKTDGEETEPADLGAILAQSMSRYLPYAEEDEVDVEEASRPPFRMAWSTLSARDGASFPIGIGVPGGCVTTVLVGQGSAVHTISIGSESCETASHAEAVEAITASGDKEGPV